MKSLPMLLLLFYHSLRGLAQVPVSMPEQLLNLWDSTRNRPVPVAWYAGQGQLKKEIIIFSHGYGANRGGDYLKYSYLARGLNRLGYDVLSIQHEIPGDSLIPAKGVIQVVRRPFWERGTDNILFLIRQLGKQLPALDGRPVILAGHSNGGDMCALFPVRYPGIATKIITLDNRRVPLPRDQRLPVLSLRSCDQPADPGVLPDSTDRDRWPVKIIYLQDIPHNDMDDDASPQQRQEILHYLGTFLTTN